MLESSYPGCLWQLITSSPDSRLTKWQPRRRGLQVLFPSLKRQYRVLSQTACVWILALLSTSSMTLGKLLNCLCVSVSSPIILPSRGHSWIIQCSINASHYHSSDPWPRPRGERRRDGNLLHSRGECLDIVLPRASCDILASTPALAPRCSMTLDISLQFSDLQSKDNNACPSVWVIEATVSCIR